MAVRATQIVKDAVQAGQLPPDPFPTAELSSSARPPSLDELKDIDDFQHLARCIERIFIKDPYDSWFASTCHYEGADFSSDPSYWAHWRERFHSTVYRVLLAGAMLYRVYQAPHVLPAKDEDRPQNLLRGFMDLEEYRASDDGLPQEFDLAESDIRYLLKFPVFNFEAFDEHEPVFGQAAEFLFNLAKKRVLRNDDIPASRRVRRHGLALDAVIGRHTKDDPVKRLFYCETMQLLLVIELFSSIQRSESFLDGLDSSRDALGQAQGRHKLLEPTEQTRKISVVLFGRFFLEEILMPTAIEDANTKLPVAVPIADQAGFRDTDILLREMVTNRGNQTTIAETWKQPGRPFNACNIFFAGISTSGFPTKLLSSTTSVRIECCTQMATCFWRTGSIAAASSLLRTSPMRIFNTDVLTECDIDIDLDVNAGPEKCPGMTERERLVWKTDILQF